MLSYRDMTFCKHYEDCDNQKTCHRPLTPLVISGAMMWWGGEDPPIAVFEEKPSCHSDNQPKEST